MKLIAEIMEIRKRGEKPLAFIRTYGCQQNVADSEKIKGMLSASGFDFTDTPDDVADPWYSGDFGRTYEDVVRGCDALIDYILSK